MTWEYTWPFCCRSRCGIGRPFYNCCFGYFISFCSRSKTWLRTSLPFCPQECRLWPVSEKWGHSSPWWIFQFFWCWVNFWWSCRPHQRCLCKREAKRARLITWLNFTVWPGSTTRLEWSDSYWKIFCRGVGRTQFCSERESVRHWSLTISRVFRGFAPCLRSQRQNLTCRSSLCLQTTSTSLWTHYLHLFN